ncbi:hypothetical protein FAI40_07695 [Acetobacteraceae bacterium]|nr:hypothetical protein FAI40_07695 [Acetobacteraceae bacterium]
MFSNFPDIISGLKRNKKRIFFEFALLFVLCAVTIFLFYFAISPEGNSDSTVAIFEALDVAQGNVLLKGWYLSELNFYFSETLPKVLMLFFGFSPKTILYFAPAFFWGLVVYLSLKIVFKKSENSWASFWIIAALIGLPAPFFIKSVLKNNNIHIGCLIIGLFLIWRMGGEAVGIRKIFLLQPDCRNVF